MWHPAPEPAGAQSLKLPDLPSPVLQLILEALPLHSLLAASSACRGLYEPALPLFGGHLLAQREQGSGRSSVTGTGSSAEPALGSSKGGGSRAAHKAQRAACSQLLRSACTHCGQVPRSHRVKEHPVNPRFRYCSSACLRDLPLRKRRAPAHCCHSRGTGGDPWGCPRAGCAGSARGWSSTRW